VVWGTADNRFFDVEVSNQPSEGRGWKNGDEIGREFLKA